MFSQLTQWWGNFISLDNSKVNTGAIFATIAIVNAFVILNWNFFIYNKPLDTGTVALLTTMIGLGGWSYQASVKAGPPGDWKPPPAKSAPPGD
jgi:hypothetical protein